MVGKGVPVQVPASVKRCGAVSNLGPGPPARGAHKHLPPVVRWRRCHCRTRTPGRPPCRDLPGPCVTPLVPPPAMACPHCRSRAPPARSHLRVHWRARPPPRQTWSSPWTACRLDWPASRWGGACLQPVTPSCWEASRWVCPPTLQVHMVCMCVCVCVCVCALTQQCKHDLLVADLRATIASLQGQLAEAKAEITRLSR